MTARRFDAAEESLDRVLAIIDGAPIAGAGEDVRLPSELRAKLARLHEEVERLVRAGEGAKAASILERALRQLEKP